MNETLHSRLRRETREVHERLESGIAVNRVMAERIRTERLSYEEIEKAREQYRGVYIRYLIGAYGFECALETAIDGTEIGRSMHHALNLESEAGPPSKLILSDLQILLPELSEADLAAMTTPPALNTISRAAGAEYVRRGSRMGGAVLARVVQNNLGFDSQVGARFLNMYGQELKARFMEFCEAINSFGSSEANGEEVVAGANDTFAAVFEWQKSLERDWETMPESTPNYLKRAWKLLVPDE